MIYNSRAYITVDEQLTSFRCRCPFRQYMLKKPAKYGIKVWTLCEAKTSYAWNMQIYTGNEHQVYVRKIKVCVCCYTLQPGSKGTQCSFSRRSSPYLRANVHLLKFVLIEECTAVSYIPKMHRIVLLFSTMHKVHKDASLSTGKGDNI
ncbi:PiggyBac transposable element-derived protein 4 [Trichinella spiralis]|uniref:PiggyBac transposable element-derived protein 4 n=1 Tax=Trichinella spiralis TaxID=6334 RepID=A0A0V1BXH3_TRISP|nr:PiggyBac transposable element-derived protein 4 [Trichinella spiralis]